MREGSKKTNRTKGDKGGGGGREGGNPHEYPECRFADSEYNREAGRLPAAFRHTLHGAEDERLTSAKRIGLRAGSLLADLPEDFLPDGHKYFRINLYVVMKAAELGEQEGRILARFDVPEEGEGAAVGGWQDDVHRPPS